MGKSRVLFASAAVVAAGIGVGGVATAHGSHSHFHVRLNGAQETPPADPDGRATADLRIDTNSGQICWELRYSRIGQPTMAHIHKQVRGVPGPIVVFFFANATHPLPDVDALESGHVDGCTPDGEVAPTLAQDIAAHPDQYYVNIHNARFPAGAVRGQIR